MQIYNTLTRKKEELVPLVPGEYKIYACGPTVYNFIHIGISIFLFFRCGILFSPCLLGHGARFFNCFCVLHFFTHKFPPF